MTYENEQYVTITEAKTILNTTDATIRSMIKSGKLKAIENPMALPKIRVRLSDVKKWQDANNWKPVSAGA